MIHYLEGDATQPIGDRDDYKLIIHVCNNVGAWGAGFVLAVSKAFGSGPEQFYKRDIKNGLLFLGKTQFVDVNARITVANMVAQTLDYRQGPNIKYDALKACLENVAEYAREKGASVHGPRFGAGLAGGKWDVIEKLINETMSDLDVYIYDYKGPGAIQWR